MLGQNALATYPIEVYKSSETGIKQLEIDSSHATYAQMQPGFYQTHSNGERLQEASVQ